MTSAYEAANGGSRGKREGSAEQPSKDWEPANKGHKQEGMGDMRGRDNGDKGVVHREMGRAEDSPPAMHREVSWAAEVDIPPVGKGIGSHQELRLGDTTEQ